MTMTWPTRDNAVLDSRSATVRLGTSAARALVVGEDKHLQQWAGGRLRQAGFEVLAADDGMDALDRARRDPPDLVVLHHIVAGVDARYVLIRLRRDPGTAHVPILLIAPCATNALGNVCRKFGVTLLVTDIRKPHAQLQLRLPSPQRTETAVEPGNQSSEGNS
jgi:CheY-like chemotaxis protein